MLNVFGGTLTGGSSSGNIPIASCAQTVQGRQTSQKLADILLNEELQVISSLELNRFATLTYHVGGAGDIAFAQSTEDLCDVLMETLASVLSKPLYFTTLALLKSLVVVEWLLLYGADRVIKEAVGTVLRPVQELLEYNTVLIAHQQQSLMLRIMGGGVDKGGPVRDKAQRICQLLTPDASSYQFPFLQQERQRKADPTSLVPLGSHRAAFMTDEVRLYVLKKRMEHEQQIQIRSNLIKPEGGYGSGFRSKDGKTVVGAAHGLDEMIKMAEREKKRFTDEGGGGGGKSTGIPLYDEHGYVAPSFAVGGVTPGQRGTSGYHDDHYTPTATAAAAAAASHDLLDVTLLSQTPSMPEVDLLDLGGGDILPQQPQQPAASLEPDLLGVGALTTEKPVVHQPSRSLDDQGLLLGLHSATTTATTMQPPRSHSYDQDSSASYVHRSVFDLPTPATAAPSLVTTTTTSTTAASGGANNSSNNNTSVWSTGTMDLLGSMSITDGGIAQPKSIANPHSSVSPFQSYDATPTPTPTPTTSTVMPSTSTTTHENEDRFAALDALVFGNTNNSKFSSTSTSNVAAFSGLTGIVQTASKESSSNKLGGGGEVGAGVGSSLWQQGTTAQLSSLSPSLPSSLLSPMPHQHQPSPSALISQQQPQNFSSSSTTTTSSTSALYDPSYPYPGATAAATSLASSSSLISTTVATSTLRVSELSSYGMMGNHENVEDDAADDDNDNPFVMGGVPGAGLVPLAPAPCAPPPPPPPSLSSPSSSSSMAFAQPPPSLQAPFSSSSAPSSSLPSDLLF